MSTTADAERWTRARLMLLETALLAAVAAGGASLTFWLFGRDSAVVVGLEALLAMPAFLVAEAYARRKRWERERREAEDLERRLRELASGRETRIK